jgi:hypothetical protein
LLEGDQGLIRPERLLELVDPGGRRQLHGFPGALPEASLVPAEPGHQRDPLVGSKMRTQQPPMRALDGPVDLTPGAVPPDQDLEQAARPESLHRRQRIVDVGAGRRSGGVLEERPGHQLVGKGQRVLVAHPHPRIPLACPELLQRGERGEGVLPRR